MVHKFTRLFFILWTRHNGQEVGERSGSGRLGAGQGASSALGHKFRSLDWILMRSGAALGPDLWPLGAWTRLVDRLLLEGDKGEVTTHSSLWGNNWCVTRIGGLRRTEEVKHEVIMPTWTLNYKYKRGWSRYRSEGLWPLTAGVLTPGGGGKGQVIAWRFVTQPPVSRPETLKL